LKLVRFKDCGLREGVRDEAFDSCGGVSPGLPREGRRLVTELSHLSVAMGYEVNELQDVISNKLGIV
jgi:hypothetical protein